MTLTSAALGQPSMLKHAFLVVLGSLFIGLAAQVEVPMVPVPMSLQTLAISIIGLTYGSRLGGATLLAYLAEGAAGLPVFAGGAAGAAHLFGPTAGFLWGFVGMAWMTGFMVERGLDRGFVRLFVAAFIPATLLFVPGVLWLWHALSMSMDAALKAGFYPFLVGDVVKSSLAALAVAGGWAALKGRRG